MTINFLILSQNSGMHYIAFKSAIFLSVEFNAAQTKLLICLENQIFKNLIHNCKKF